MWPIERRERRGPISLWVHTHAQATWPLRKRRQKT